MTHRSEAAELPYGIVGYQDVGWVGVTVILGEVGPVAEVCNGTVSLGNKAQLFNHLSKFGCDIAYDHMYHHTHNQMDLTMRR